MTRSHHTATGTFLSILALSLTSVANLSAQNNSPVQTSYFNQLRNRNDNGNGSVAVDRFNIRGGLPLMQENGSLLAIGFRYALDRYSFQGTTANWETIHQTDLGLASRWKINDDWLWSNYSILGIAAEESSHQSDGFVATHLSMAEYKVNDKLTIGPGIGITHEIDRGISLFPIVLLNWQINDEWRMASGPSDVAAAGANIYFDFTPEALQEKWTFTFGAHYSSKNFKLASNSTTTDGSGEEAKAAAYLAASYRLYNGLKFSAIAGYQFYQSYSIFDNAGTELSRENLDDAAFVGVSAGIDF